jgi:hypothetical protein
MTPRLLLLTIQHERELTAMRHRRLTDPAWLLDPVWGPLGPSLSWNRERTA